jgi:uncharacterized membrane protein YfcA
MTTELLVVCLAAFAAGFIDAIVGGGGLVQTPILFLTFPHEPVTRILGTTKIPSFSGTAISLYQYSKHVAIQWKLVAWIASAAFCASLLGSRLVSMISSDTIKPVILVTLIGVAIYTYTRKNFGQQEAKDIPFATLLVRGIISGLLIGFYDGFIGPGTGSFLILVFIGLLGNDFLHASAHAKLVNLATNVASIIYFAWAGAIIYELALPMAACNMTGGFMGSRLALLKGNKFIRIFFLLIVFGTILRFGYDVLL